MGVARFSQAVINSFFITENSVLYTELLARLLFFATSYPAMIGQLCQQAQSWFRACPHPMLVPLAGFLQPPGGRFRATLTGCHKGECPQHHKKNTPAHCIPRGADARYLGLLSGAPLCQTGGPKVPWGPSLAISCRPSPSLGTVGDCCKYC